MLSKIQSLNRNVLVMGRNGYRVCRDDVTTGTEVQDRGECLGLYPYVLIIFRLT